MEGETDGIREVRTEEGGTNDEKTGGRTEGRAEWGS